jgi:Tfp pilus assembly PilM family ATPase
VGRIILTGGGAAIPGMLAYLARQLGTSVEAGDPFPHREVRIEPDAFQTLSAQPTAFAPCLGLLAGGGESNDPDSCDERIS